MACTAMNSRIRFPDTLLACALLGAWVVEIFARLGEIHPATLIEVQVWPSWVSARPGYEPYGPDWIADSRVTGLVREVRDRTPAGLVAELARAVAEHEKAGRS